MYDSAVREAVAAGRGECFVERYLDRPRHVETQVLADQHGNAVVVSTRDCSLQRRHQKLVEEAPAPFLTPQQEESLYEASKAIVKEAGYYGAGTCEFLVGEDGVISFLEVNTRLQVEHPVSEEVTGIDLVREQFRIARGEVIGTDDPVVRGHSIEFRINGEDPGRGFLPAPGSLITWKMPSGPGVRVDAGFRAGDVIGGNFDSLLAKLVVTGKDRTQALQRARRALAEFEVEGIATALTFTASWWRRTTSLPRTEPPFVCTRAGSKPNSTIRFRPTTRPPWPINHLGDRESVVVEVEGKRIEVTLPAGFRSPAPTHGTKKAAPRRRNAASGSAATGDAVAAPMQGTIVKVEVAEGDSVNKGDLIVVLEAMKMEQPLTAQRGRARSPASAQTSGRPSRRVGHLN